ncbi:MAG: hypothetical protein MJA27_30680, partial [Pseudanabaenales cyanobacterium]|nr:hypothetical protein [Pseudanabaenales cyanobacterium]
MLGAGDRTLLILRSRSHDLKDNQNFRLRESDLLPPLPPLLFTYSTFPLAPQSKRDIVEYDG